jgi:hypothetical protein
LLGRSECAPQRLQSSIFALLKPRMWSAFLQLPSLIPVRVDRQGLKGGGLRGFINLSGVHSLQEWEVFLSTADQQGQEQNKHQDAKQDFEWRPDIYPRRWRIPITLLHLFDAVIDASQEFSSLLCIELIFTESQGVQTFEHTNRIDDIS